MQEIWKDIPGFEGKYQISNCGKVKSLNYCNTDKEKVLVNKVNHRGYEYVCLCKNNQRQYPRIHRLVAENFIENRGNLEQVNHIDGNKKNNVVSNLEWCTQTENIHHAMKNGLLNLNGSDNPKARKVVQLSLSGKVIRYYDTIVQAGKELGIKHKPTGITRVCKGAQKTAYGFKWKYA